ncbi:MAG: membrane protein insertion efficiency factor YidD [Deltaproteobacteria bacterium]|nr:membrane protein insertion efficiency factor YidD [Candidatus Tharpellaceae bacterium]RLB57747.1 MAG: membrane protein insertion efficiency factor YidD [Deltaproteobacteria bacterium]HDJ28313.1 membrane protein insertion efficiency factor YidD [Pseudomonadota bacterium]
MLIRLYCLPIKIYQVLISPYMGHSCRFVPSCSQYALDAIGRYGIILGTMKAVLRILRCNPFFPGGIDPA